MSATVIQQAEKQIEEAKHRIKSEKIREAKDAIKNALKNNDDKALSDACIKFYAHSKPPPVRKPKEKVQSPV